MGLVSLLFGFNGRINRVQYWLGCVIGGVGGAMLLFMLTLLTMPAGGVFPKSPEGMAHFLSTVSLAFGIPFTLMGWIGTALQVKRFHDRGRSGLWVLAPLLPMVMIVVNIISAAATGANFENFASSLGMWLLILQVVNLVMFVDLGCMPGKPEANKYGNPTGGGFSGGGGAPVGGAPYPGQTAAKGQPIPGMGSTLVSAESAIERAIAARAKQAQAAPAAPMSSAPRPAMATAQPVAGMRPAAGGSFGRKTTR